MSDAAWCRSSGDRRPGRSRSSARCEPGGRAAGRQTQPAPAHTPVCSGRAMISCAGERIVRRVTLHRQGSKPRGRRLRPCRTTTGCAAVAADPSAAAVPYIEGNVAGPGSAPRLASEQDDAAGRPGPAGLCNGRAIPASPPSRGRGVAADVPPHRRLAPTALDSSTMTSPLHPVSPAFLMRQVVPRSRSHPHFSDGLLVKIPRLIRLARNPETQRRPQFVSVRAGQPQRAEPRCRKGRSQARLIVQDFAPCQLRDLILIEAPARPKRCGRVSDWRRETFCPVGSSRSPRLGLGDPRLHHLPDRRR